ncbi:terminase gpA endonuclease subunit [Hyphobacterium sp.]|uniref:terminase gpA endonuclease subunit n=1 Tax=Hyphobacterium sp. TaxID=2004662 RepID=UPI003B5264ED
MLDSATRSCAGDGGYGSWPELDQCLDAAVTDLRSAAVEAVTPDPPFDLLEWTKENRVFDDGSAYPGAYDPDTAPYLNEIFQLASPQSGKKEITVIKCAQSGGTVVLESFFAAVPALIPGPGMLVHPTVKAFKDWCEEKWWPMVHATACLDPFRGGEVLGRTDKASGGSTADRLKFRKGGWIAGAGANSAATLRQKSIRYMGLDDLDGFDDDADGEGDPENLAHQRTKTYRRRGLAITLRVSTPLLEGSSRIMKHYQRSDRRRFYHACLDPDCGALTDFDWEDIRREDTRPWRSYVVCPECGTPHSHADKREMQQRGVWIPTVAIPDQVDPDGKKPVEGQGLEPGKTVLPEHVEFWRSRPLGRYEDHAGVWITGVMNFAETWDSIADAEEQAGEDPDALKVFNNTTLGRTYKIDSKTPEWEALSAARCEDFHRGSGAHGPRVFTLSCDVQGFGIYWLIKGWNAREEAWYLDWGLAPGETDTAGEGAWKELTRIADRGAPLPGGARFPFDKILVDAKYNAEAVKDWVKRRPAALAINGAPGWNKPIIFRTHQEELTKSGKKKKFGLRVWHIGTWPAKNIVVTRLARTVSRRALTEEGPPEGYCWFPIEADEAFFRQLTSEYLLEKPNKQTQRIERKWVVRTGQENHLFDCDVYSIAGLHFIGARAKGRGTWTAEMWADRDAAIFAEIKAAGGQADLFDAAFVRPDAGAPSGPVEKQTPELPPALAAMARKNKGS